MRILWILTKPPWPADEGGKRVVWDSLRPLAESAEIVLVAPIAPEIDAEPIAEALRPYCEPILVPSHPKSRVGSLLRGMLRFRPTTIEKHDLPRVRREVARLLEKRDFDLVLCEQAQAFCNAEPALKANVPTVLRAQNVESDLWRATAQARRWAGLLLRSDAVKLAFWEGATACRASATTTLTREDAARLSELASNAGWNSSTSPIEAIPAPFPTRLPAADAPLKGSPAVVLFGAGGWWPNRAGARWFVEEVWPAVLKRRSEAVLHVYGADDVAGESVVVRPSPEDSREAFAPGSIQVVPLHVASGVRIKILEAWARGVPIVATSIAARGLDAEDGRELLLADDAESFARAVDEAADPLRRAEIVAAAREKLDAEHAPERVAMRHLALFERLIGGSS